MTTVLTKGDGSSTTYQNAELLTILASLEASNNTHVEASGVAFTRLAPNRLLLLDVNTTLGRRLLEIYAVSYESTNAFGLKFTSSNVDYDTQGAVNAAGFSTIVTTLANINAATLYNILGEGVYLAQTNLVKHQGAFQTGPPAQLKNLLAGNGCTLAETADSVQLDVSPITINIPPPPYGHAQSNQSTFAESTIFSYSNNALVFTSPLTTSTASLGSVTFDGVQQSNFEVTHVLADVYSKGQADALFAPLGSPVDLSNYSTTAQIQAMIDSAKQAVLDSILIGDADLEIDRSISGQITINLPSYAWPADIVYTFDGTQDANQTFDTSQTTVVGAKLPVSLSSQFTIQFDFRGTAPNPVNEVVFYIGGSPWFVQLYQYNADRYDFYIPGHGAEHYAYYSSFVTCRVVFDSTGLKLYIDDVLKGSHTLSNLNTAYSLGMYLGSTYANGNKFTGQMRNFSIS